MVETLRSRSRESRSDSRVVNSQSGFTTVLDSSMVEHAAVNRGVVGSSPTRGVETRKHICLRVLFYFHVYY